MLDHEEVCWGAEPCFHGSQSFKPGIMVGGGEVGVGLHSRQLHENRHVSGTGISVKVIRL